MRRFAGLQKHLRCLRRSSQWTRWPCPPPRGVPAPVSSLRAWPARQGAPCLSSARPDGAPASARMACAPLLLVSCLSAAVLLSGECEDAPGRGLPGQVAPEGEACLCDRCARCVCDSTTHGADGLPGRLRAHRLRAAVCVEDLGPHAGAGRSQSWEGLSRAGGQPGCLGAAASLPSSHRAARGDRSVSGHQARGQTGR